MRNRQCLCGFARIAYRAPVASDCSKTALLLAEPPTNFSADCSVACHYLY
jgi:hypothetical protein